MNLLAGSALSVLPAGVVLLDPQQAMFGAMLEGWERQQRTRFLRASTIAPRLSLIRRLHEFTGHYPWQWDPADVEAFFDSLRSAPTTLAASTARGYQVTIRMFLDFVTDRRYGWAAECQQRFGQAPIQVLHEWNSITHVTEFEGQPGRRPLSYDEVQALFDAADGRADEIRARRRKGALAAMRDAALLKVIYAYGLRRREAANLDLTDLRHNPKLPDFGRFGALFVRFGKASSGSAPKRRTVLTVPEMDWVLPVLEQWIDEMRGLFDPGRHPALWVTERASRVSIRSVDDAFRTARAAAGLDPELSLHCLRHSYVTHLVEFDYPERFISDQVGHAYASTTAIYNNSRELHQAGEFSQVA
jgi:site-specific recombinase XerD